MMSNANTYIIIVTTETTSTFNLFICRKCEVPNRINIAPQSNNDTAAIKEPFVIV